MVQYTPQEIQQKTEEMLETAGLIRFVQKSQSQLWSVTPPDEEAEERSILITIAEHTEDMPNFTVLLENKYVGAIVGLQIFNDRAEIMMANGDVLTVPNIDRGYFVLEEISFEEDEGTEYDSCVNIQYHNHDIDILYPSRNLPRYPRFSTEVALSGNGNMYYGEVKANLVPTDVIKHNIAAVVAPTITQAHIKLADILAGLEQNFNIGFYKNGYILDIDESGKLTGILKILSLEESAVIVRDILKEFKERNLRRRSKEEFPINYPSLINSNYLQNLIKKECVLLYYYEKYGAQIIDKEQIPDVDQETLSDEALDAYITSIARIVGFDEISKVMVHPDETPEEKMQELVDNISEGLAAYNKLADIAGITDYIITDGSPRIWTATRENMEMYANIKWDLKKRIASKHTEPADAETEEAADNSSTESHVFKIDSGETPIIIEINTTDCIEHFECEASIYKVNETDEDGMVTSVERLRVLTDHLLSNVSDEMVENMILKLLRMSKDWIRGEFKIDVDSCEKLDKAWKAESFSKTDRVE